MSKRASTSATEDADAKTEEEKQPTEKPSKPVRSSILHAESAEEKQKRQEAELEWKRNHKYPNLLYLVDNLKFETAMGIVITFNCVTIGIQTDSVDKSFGFIALLEQIFTLIFVIELSLKILVYGWRKTCFGSFYKFCDVLLILVTGVLVGWVLEPLGASGGAFRNLQVLRALRLARVMRVVKALPLFRTMYLLMQGLVESSTTLFWSSLCVTFNLFVFGVFATVIIGQDGAWTDTDIVRTKWFGGVAQSMFTMFQIMLLDDAFVIIQHVEEGQGGMWVFFVLYLGLSTMCLMNLITAVVLEQSMDMVKEDEATVILQMEEKEAETRKLLERIFLDIQTGGKPQMVGTLTSYTLTKEDWMSAMRRPEIRQKLNEMDLDKDQCEELFAVLDSDQTQTIDRPEFVEGLIQMQGEAKAKDLWIIMQQLSALGKSVTEAMTRIDSLDATMVELEYQISAIFKGSQETHELLPLVLSEPVTKKGKVRAKQTKQGSAVDKLVSRDAEVDNSIVPVEDKALVFEEVPNSARAGRLQPSCDPVAMANVKYCILRAAFVALDQDGSENLDLKEFTAAASRLDLHPDDARCVFAAMDVDKDGSLSMEEFCHNLAVEVLPTPIKDHSGPIVKAKHMLFLHAFQSGNVDYIEPLDQRAFVEALSKFGCVSEYAAEVFQWADREGAGVATLEEFSRLVSLDASAVDSTLPLQIRHILLLESLRRAAHKNLGMVVAARDLQVLLQGLMPVKYANKLCKTLGIGNDLAQVNLVQFCHALAGDDNDLYKKAQMGIVRAGLLATGIEDGIAMNPDDFVFVLAKLGVKRPSARKAFVLIDKAHKLTVTIEDTAAWILGGRGNAVLQTFANVKYAILMAAFKYIDVSQDSSVSPHEFIQALRKLRISATDAMKVFTEIDTDQSGSISVQEFCHAMALDSGREHFARVRWACLKVAIFGLNVSDAASSLSKEAFVARCVELGAKEEDSSAMFDRVDMNQDGAVSLDELVHGLALEGSQASDPRVLMVLKYCLLRMCFIHIDHDSDYRVSKEEFMRVAVQLDQRREDASRVFEEMDKQARGYLGLSEFCHALAVEAKSWSVDPILEKAYKSIRRGMFDVIFEALHVARNKSVDVKELVNILYKAGVTRKDANSAFTMLDSGHAGFLTMQQFVDALADFDK